MVRKPEEEVTILWDGLECSCEILVEMIHRNHLDAADGHAKG